MYKIIDSFWVTKVTKVFTLSYQFPMVIFCNGFTIVDPFFSSFKIYIVNFLLDSVPSQ